MAKGAAEYSIPASIIEQGASPLYGYTVREAGSSGWSIEGQRLELAELVLGPDGVNVAELIKLLRSEHEKSTGNKKPWGLSWHSDGCPTCVLINKWSP